MAGCPMKTEVIYTFDGANDDIEILVVEGEIKTKKCRFINGYGPQESAGIDKRINFFARLATRGGNYKSKTAGLSVMH